MAKMNDVKLEFDQLQTPPNGKAILWMCNPEHEHLAYSMMHHNLWWILKETLGVDPGRVRFYELSAFQSPQCEHVSWCDDPDEIVAAMENSEFDSCVVFPLEYVARDPSIKAVYKTLRISGTTIHMGSIFGAMERTASRLVETAHRLGLNVVIISSAVHGRYIGRDYMPYLEEVVPEMDLVIADRGENVQIRTPDGKILTDKSWKDITEAPFIKIKSSDGNKCNFAP